ncbi:MAG TPA: hypothetical protein PK052_11735, partial [Anaerohalosphaeraceae bacterium]|nr:hypothetical protein [Anaerohalosphaeraceae bacterium]
IYRSQMQSQTLPSRAYAPNLTGFTPAKAAPCPAAAQTACPAAAVDGDSICPMPPMGADSL